MASSGGSIQTFVADADGIRIDAWLTDKISGTSRSFVQKLLKDGQVRVNGMPVKQNYRIKVNDQIEVYLPEPEKLDVEPENITVDILFEDNDIIVIDKPKGMVVHPGAGNFSGTMVNALMYLRGESLSDINGILRPGIVHRIDKDTTGIIVVAKNNHAHRFLSEKFKAHDIERVYYAVVDGVIYENKGKIDAPIGRHPVDRKKMAVNISNGRRAVTYFKVIERFRNATFVEVTLETGRTHQIRVHMAYIGHPVLGDEVYGRKHINKKYNLDSQVLHAGVLGFVHPSTGERLTFRSELPKYFSDLLYVLRNE